MPRSRITPQQVAEVRSWFKRGRHIPEVIPVDPDDTATWLIQRRVGLGGSDIAAILGHSSHIGALGTYLSKVGQVPEDDDPDPVEAEWAYWGHRLEEVVASEFTKRTGVKVRKPGVMFQHPVHRWMLASPDRLIFKGRSRLARTALEIKTRSAFVATQWAKGAVPPEVYDQVQHYIEVLGLETYWLAALIGGQSMLHARIQRDPERIAQIITAGERFWHENVEKRIPPVADATDGTTNAVKGAFIADGTKVELPTDDAIQRYYALGQTIAELEKDRTQAANEIRMALKESEEGWFHGKQLVTWRPGEERTVFDDTTLRQEMPEVWAKYVKTKPPVRTLRLTKAVA